MPSAEALPRSVARSGTSTLLPSIRAKVVSARLVSFRIEALSW